MSNPVQFGVRLPVAGPLSGPEPIGEIAVLAEELGYDALWVHDYLVWTHELDRTHVSCGAIELIKDDTEPLFYESLTTLAYVAALTSRVELGIAVLILPYREPLFTAKQLANIDRLSNGRLICGVGVGAPRRTNNQDFEVLGVPRTQKYTRAEEQLRILKTIWTEDAPAHEGPRWQFPPTTIFPKPIRKPHPPIWFGGSGPRTIDLLARFGDGWLPAWLTPDAYEEKIAELETAAAEHGRPGHHFEIGTEIVACIAETDEEADQISGRTLKTLTAGFTVTSTDQARQTSLIGTPDSIRERIEAYQKAGVTHFELKFVYQSISSLEKQLRLFSEHIIHR